jgi:hypothetical protein
MELYSRAKKFIATANCEKSVIFFHIIRYLTVVKKNTTVRYYVDGWYSG